MSTGQIVVLVVVVLAAAGLVIWLVPRLQVRRWRRTIDDEQKLAELEVNARGSLVQALGGLALIVTLAVTISQVNDTRKSAERAQKSADRNLALAERGQVSERFSRAVDQLGDDDADVRVGALFSLMRIGVDSAPNRRAVYLIAAAFVRQQYETPDPLPAPGCGSHPSVPDDVSTALRFVLPRVGHAMLDEKKRPIRRLVGLRGAHLGGLAIDSLVLRQFDLPGVRFVRASLAYGNFRDSRLSYAHLREACLNHATFEDADLTGADFRGAELRGANFRGARLEGARFDGANVARARFAVSDEALEQLLTRDQRSQVRNEG